MKLTVVLFYIVAILAGGVSIYGCNQSTVPTVEVKEFIQITIRRLDAGIHEVESIRVSTSGSLETAIWSEPGFLTGLSGATKAPAGLFDGIVHYLSYHDATKVDGRRALIVDLAHFKSDGLQFISLNNIPDGLDALVNTALEAAPPKMPSPGRYIWTAPYAHIGVVDIDLRERKCKLDIACTIADSLLTGQLIVPAPQNIDEFLSGARINRVQFGAETVAGRVRFGVLSAH